MHGEQQSFNWISQIPGLEHAPNHVIMAIGVISLLLVLMMVARAQLNSVVNSPGEGLVPESKLNIRNFFEVVAEKLYGLTESILGHHDAPKYFPIVGFLFIFVFTCNIAGSIPGLTPPTDTLNTTLALGLFVFLYYNYIGIRENGLGYLKHFFGPFLPLAPLIFVIEIVSHLVRPISLAFRLKWNMFSDHIVLHTFADLVPLFVPVVFMMFGIFVSFVQAFVFSLMTMVYISLSSSHDEH